MIDLIQQVETCASRPHNQPQAASLLGSPHYEVVRRVGCREYLIGRYASRAVADVRQRDETRHGLGGDILVRFREF